jgi:hypothetical protein
MLYDGVLVNVNQVVFPNISGSLLASRFDNLHRLAVLVIALQLAIDTFNDVLFLLAFHGSPLRSPWVIVAWPWQGHPSITHLCIPYSDGYHNCVALPLVLGWFCASARAKVLRPRVPRFYSARVYYVKRGVKKGLISPCLWH